MLSAKNRLPSEEFRSRGYATTKTPYFLLKAKNNGLKKGRVGLVVSKAVHKSAVTRNFWKRQAREGLSRFAVSSQDILVIFSPAVGKLTKEQFQKELTKATKGL